VVGRPLDRSHRLRHSPSFGAVVRGGFGAACGLWLLLAGCQSTPGEHYTTKTLPPNLIASRRDNAQTIDLSRLASLAVNSEVIDRGDVIEVTIATGLSEKENFTQGVRVRDDGTAEVPVVGPVQVAGMELVEAEAAISAACIQRQLYRNPYVTVTMKHQRVNNVTVVGAVEKPGVYRIPRGRSDLLAAIVEAGGLSEDAGTNVEIRNPSTGPKSPDPIASTNPGGLDAVGHSVPGQTVGTLAPALRDSIRVDLVSATKNGTGYVVGDGAVVHVEKRDPEPVHVLGLVHKPNRYEFPIGQDLRVLEAISLAGGITNPVADKIFVIRKKPESSQTAIVEMKISEAKRNEKDNLLLSPGDVVSVEQTPLTIFLDTIRLINVGVGASLPLTAL
jgi:polysaccharide export outer membrane protein